MKVWMRYKPLVQRFMLHFLLILAFWGGMLRRSFNCDTLCHMTSPDADILHRVRCGRYFIALCDEILLRMGLRTTDNLSVFMLLAFLLLAAALVEIQNIFAEWMPEKPWRKAGFLCGIDLVFLNVLFAEPLMFSEMAVYFALAYYTAVLGVRFYVRQNWVMTFIMYTIAVSTYQTSVILAAILLAVYICLDERMILSGRAVVREIVGVGICMGMGALNYLSLKILDRIGVIYSVKNISAGSPLQRLSDAFGHFVEINRDGGGIFPNLWIPLLFTVGVWLLILVSCVKGKKWMQLGFVFLLWLGCNALNYVIPILQGGGLLSAPSGVFLLRYTGHDARGSLLCL